MPSCYMTVVLSLILQTHVQGYAGGDEAKMLRRHLLQTSAKIGVGANRRAIAASVLERYGHMDSAVVFAKLSFSQRLEPDHGNKNVGVVILDDGMQVFIYASWLSSYGFVN